MAQWSGDTQSQKVGDLFQRILPKLKQVPERFFVVVVVVGGGSTNTGPQEYQRYITDYDMMRERIKLLRTQHVDFAVRPLDLAHAARRSD